MLPRTIDKARARLAGTLGDYIYDCPMDRQLFATLGIDAESLLEAVKQASDDDGVASGLRERTAQLSAQQIAHHNAAIETWAPKSDAGRARFERQRARIAPHRPDVTTWTDLIDCEEGRISAAR